MVDIIIRKVSPKGKIRSKIEKELRKEGWGSSLTDEQIDKCEWLEKEAKEKLGGDSGILRTKNINKVK